MNAQCLTFKRKIHCCSLNVCAPHPQPPNVEIIIPKDDIRSWGLWEDLMSLGLGPRKWD